MVLCPPVVCDSPMDRLIQANMMVLNQEPRQTTSNLGHLNKPSIQALIHGLNRHYYSISINYRKNELEQKMLLNLNKKSWEEGLILQEYKVSAVRMTIRSFHDAVLSTRWNCSMDR